MLNLGSIELATLLRAKYRRRKAVANILLRLDLHSFPPSFSIVDTPPASTSSTDGLRNPATKTEGIGLL
jgi:hypothetical protein